MKNTLGDLNNYLFEQLERLNDDSLTQEQLNKEMTKVDCVVKVADRIIQNGELVFKTLQHMDEFGYNLKPLKVPQMLDVRKEHE